MTLQITTWQPDTCKCRVRYAWDDTVPEDMRTHMFYAVLRRCPAHMAGTEASVYDRLMDENPRKNRGIETAMSHIPGLTLEDCDFSYDAQRVLVLRLPTGKVSVPQMNSLNGLLVAAFGPGKVKIERV